MIHPSIIPRKANHLLGGGPGAFSRAQFHYRAAVVLNHFINHFQVKDIGGKPLPPPVYITSVS